MLWSLVVVAGVVAAVVLMVQRGAKSKARAVDPVPTKFNGADVIVGRAISETIMRAPLSGRECVYWTVMITKPADRSFARSESRTTIVGLEPASSERIKLTGDRVRYALSSVSATETKLLPLREMPTALRALLERDGKDDDVFEVFETTILPSSTIHATGAKTAPGELHVEAIYDAPPSPPVVRSRTAR